MYTEVNTDENPLQVGLFRSALHQWLVFRLKLYSLCNAIHLSFFISFRGKSAPPIRVIGGGKTSVFRDNIRWAYTPYVAVPPPATGLRPLRKEKSPAKDDMCWLRISSIQLRHPGIRYPDRTYPQQSLPQWLGC